MPVESLTAPALVVVDVQGGTIPNARAIPEAPLIERIVELLASFRGAGRPVSFVVSTGSAPGATDFGPGGRVWPDGFADLDDRLARQAAEPLRQRVGWSAFAGTDLQADLERAAVREVVIVGLATTFGVESTARAAADLGFDVVVVSDAVSDPDPQAHDRSLTRVLPALGRVATAAEVAAALPARG